MAEWKTGSITVVNAIIMFMAHVDYIVVHVQCWV